MLFNTTDSESKLQDNLCDGDNHTSFSDHITQGATHKH